MTLSAREAHDKKVAPPVSGVLPIFHERWSPRSFAEKQVSRETLHQVFEAARWAASSNNEQPWRFVVGLKGTETWQKIFDSLVEGNQKWAKNAPVLIVGASHGVFSKNGRTNGFALYDLGAAVGYLTLQAAALGLATHQMAGYDKEKAKGLLGIPEEFLLGAVIALGYQDEPEKLADPGLIERETTTRERKPIGEFVFGGWDETLGLG